MGKLFRMTPEKGLKEAYERGYEEGSVNFEMILYGFDFADELAGLDLRGILLDSGIEENNINHIRNGMKLAPFVQRINASSSQTNIYQLKDNQLVASLANSREQGEDMNQLWLTITLSGIRHSDQLIDFGANKISTLCRRAGLSPNSTQQFKKGVRLGQFLKLRRR